MSDMDIAAALKTPEFAKALAEGRINVEYSNDEDGVTTLNITANETEERIIYRDGMGPERIVEVAGPERIIPGPERIIHKGRFKAWFWGFVKGVFITILVMKYHTEIGGFFRTHDVVGEVQKAFPLKEKEPCQYVFQKAGVRLCNEGE